MKRFALPIALLTFTACADIGETHHVNETGDFCLTVPGNFEERRVTIVGDEPTPGTDLYDLVGTMASENDEFPVTLTIGVNRYDPNLPPGKIFIEHVWQLEDDGSLTHLDRDLRLPGGDYTYPPVAVSLFFDSERTLYFFRMDLEEDGFEDLFVDIVGSFQSLR